jgi:phosphoglucosamine mutase
MFEYALCTGLMASGADAYIMHVTTTPSVAYITRIDDFDCGIMISASHNPFYDNGIKLLNSKGEKMEEDTLLKVEEYIDDKLEIPVAARDEIGRTVDYVAGRNRYVGYLISLGLYSFRGIKVALDCANGCAASTAEKLFTALGAETIVIADKPDGTNINRECGSTNVHRLMEVVIGNGCDCGLAFDGDADRCIAVDEKGELVDGDRQLAIFARYMKEKGTLFKNTAVVTAGSTLGFRRYASDHGIKLVSSGAGTLYVLERMLEGGYKLGGEPNGHIIFLDDAGTGDGQLAGARLLSIMKQSGMKLSELAGDMPAYQQVKLNVKIPTHYKELWKNEKDITELIESFGRELGDEGRLVIRESGKEPIVRILIEGADFGRINDMAVEIAQTIKDTCAYKV